jgi:hypothetical protein
MPTPSAEENDRGGLEVAERRVLDRKAGSAKRNPVSAREEIALVNTTNGKRSPGTTGADIFCANVTMTFSEQPNQAKQTQKQGEHVARFFLLAH